MAADQPLLPLAHVVFRLRGDRPLLYQQYRPIEADLLYYVRYQAVSDVLQDHRLQHERGWADGRQWQL